MPCWPRPTFTRSKNVRSAVCVSKSSQSTFTPPLSRMSLQTAASTTGTAPRTA